MKGEYFASISPHETYLASSSIFSRRISLWSIDTGKVVKELPGHISATMAVAFSEDEKLLASAGTDGTIKVWNLETRDFVEGISCAAI
jgi:WD40 repeat protein